MNDDTKKDIALVAACWIASFAVGNVVGQAAKALTKNAPFPIKIGAFVAGYFLLAKPASEAIVGAATPYFSENRRGKA
jgi:hypothetical protein